MAARRRTRKAHSVADAAVLRTACQDRQERPRDRFNNTPLSRNGTRSRHGAVFGFHWTLSTISALRLNARCWQRKSRPSSSCFLSPRCTYEDLFLGLRLRLCDFDDGGGICLLETGLLIAIMDVSMIFYYRHRCRSLAERGARRMTAEAARSLSAN